jgi:hypothetical protein
MSTLIPLTVDAPAHESAVGVAYRRFLDGLPVRAPRRILFINIPQVPADIFSPETARLNGYHIYPPIGYLYLAAAARRADPDVELAVLDLNYEMLRRCHEGTLPANLADFWKPLVAEAVTSGSASLHVCVGNMFEATSQQFLDVAGFVKATFPNVTLLAGGVQVTLDYREILDGGLAHAVLRHEAEDQFTALLRACSDEGGAPEAPGGIAFTVDGAVHEAAGHEGTGEFLDIRPYYDLIDIENYHRYGGVNPYSRYVGKEKPFSTVLSNRGCRAACTFCGVESFNGRGVRRRSARSVVDEIKYLVDNKGIKVIEWLDDDLLYGRPQSVELFKLMAEEMPGLQWIANNGVIAGAVSEDVMHWMVKSGCLAFKVGIESGNDAMLRKIKKPGTKAGLRKAGQIFGQYPEVFVSGNFIVGFPMETVSELLDSYHFAEELSWDWANYYICQPLPGTDMFDAFQSMGDDRCGKDDYRVYNPGKSSAQKGNFGYYKGYHSDDGLSRSLKSGRDVLNLPPDLVPSPEQIKEIWFTFNLLSNFINNRNFQPGGNPMKIVKWFESIAASYPRDAGMCAMLAHGHQLLGNTARSRTYRDKFHSLVDEYDYWKRRIEEFPELAVFAG